MFAYACKIMISSYLPTLVINSLHTFWVVCVIAHATQLFVGNRHFLITSSLRNIFNLLMQYNCEFANYFIHIWAVCRLLNSFIMLSESCSVSARSTQWTCCQSIRCEQYVCQTRHRLIFSFWSCACRLLLDQSVQSV